MQGVKGSKKNVRKYPGFGGSRHNPVGVKVRREAAAIRDEEAKKRTPLEQLARLDARGCVAKRERARLEAKLKAPPATEKKSDVIAPEKKPKLKAKERRANA